jgi:hypothetical protein
MFCNISLASALASFQILTNTRSLYIRILFMTTIFASLNYLSSSTLPQLALVTIPHPHRTPPFFGPHSVLNLTLPRLTVSSPATPLDLVLSTGRPSRTSSITSRGQLVLDSSTPATTTREERLMPSPMLTTRATRSPFVQWEHFLSTSLGRWSTGSPNFKLQSPSQPSKQCTWRSHMPLEQFSGSDAFCRAWVPSRWSDGPPQ